jgi:hypothetical protein
VIPGVSFTQVFSGGEDAFSILLRKRAWWPVEGSLRLCGQAIRGARWRAGGGEALLRHLDTRAVRYATRTGGSAYEVGDRAALMKVMSRAPQVFPLIETILVQPGLSVRAQHG